MAGKSNVSEEPLWFRPPPPLCLTIQNEIGKKEWNSEGAGVQLIGCRVDTGCVMLSLHQCHCSPTKTIETYRYELWSCVQGSVLSWLKTDLTEEWNGTCKDPSAGLIFIAAAQAEIIYEAKWAFWGRYRRNIAFSKPADKPINTTQWFKKVLLSCLESAPNHALRCLWRMCMMSA